MPKSWYESYSDRKDHLLFVKRSIDADKGYLNPPHIHASIEFFFGIKGESYVYINDKRYSLVPGKIIFINSFEAHRCDYMEGTECYVVNISPSYFNEINDLRQISFPSELPPSESFEKLHAFLDLQHSIADTGSVLYNTGFVNSLVYLLTEGWHASFNKEQAKTNEILIKIVQYIDAHFKEDISIGMISRRFGYSPNYLSSIFNKYMSISFRDHINRCRIAEFAQIKAASPDIPTYRAAELAGFKNLSTFYNALRRAQAEPIHIDDFCTVGRSERF